jgi:alpha-beta hydrolase superfamily lysophospholipase
MVNSVYYLTGMGGRLDSGLGPALLSRRHGVAGRELVGEFRQLGFQEQIDTVVNDLQSSFWDVNSRVIANSFGAYLFLHAQVQLPPYPGKVLLLSPIVGEFANQETEMNFIPPRSEQLLAMASTGLYPAPLTCEIHVGSEDWQSNPRNVEMFGSLTGIGVTVVPQAGHMLPKEYVNNLLDRWLS